MFVAYNGHLKLVKFLIEAVADINAMLENGVITLDLAKYMKQDEVIKLLENENSY